MKLVRFGTEGSEKPGVLDADGNVRDLSGIVTDITGQEITASGLEALRAVDIAKLPIVPAGTRLGAPIGAVGKIVCVGLNYSDHAREAAMPVPKEPILFFKSTTAICGPYDTVLIPPGSTKSDWEVELGVVIGKIARRITEEQALEHIAGYLIVNDLSEREYQLERGGQWVKGKSCDTFGPLGPWLVTRDEVDVDRGLHLWLSLNGVRTQSSTTANMIFGVAKLVSYISTFMTLMPGDIVSTGTPAGVGMGLKPPKFLRPHDVMELGIEGLGTQRQSVA